MKRCISLTDAAAIFAAAAVLSAGPAAATTYQVANVCAPEQVAALEAWIARVEQTARQRRREHNLYLPVRH